MKQTPEIAYEPVRPKVSRWKRWRDALFRFLDDFRSQFSSDPLERCRWISITGTRKSTSEKPKDCLARAGEDEAVRILRDSGYTIMHRNVFFHRCGELDIVAKKNGVLVFVEVKTRRRREWGDPRDAVNARKQKHLIAAARRYIKRCRVYRVPFRFDIVEIIWPDGKLPEVTHLEDAFSLDDNVENGR